MTVCKTFNPLVPEKGNSYRRADLLAKLDGSEKMASSYFDPPRDELRTFFDEDSADWENVMQSGLFRFRHRKGLAQGETPAWERTKKRYLFLHRTGKPAGEYEYIGMAIDDERIPPDGSEWKQYVLR